MARPVPLPLLLITGSALFMEMLDSSVIVTALPHIAASLHTTPVRLNLALIAYVLGLAIFMPLSGWAADRFGIRNVLRVAIFVFMTGSILCGISRTYWFFVGARLLQGAGGALMTPVSRLLLLRIAPRKELLSLQTWITIPSLSGMVLGPPLGGLIVTYMTWPWIFFINLPVGMIGLWAVTRYAPNQREARRSPLDRRGFLLVGTTLVCLLFGFETMAHGLLPLPTTLSLLIVGTVAALFYYLHFRRAPHPLIDFGLLQNKVFRLTMIGGTFFRMLAGATPFLLALLFQVGFGYSALTSGILSLGMAIGAILAKFFVSAVIRRYGYRPTLIFNTGVTFILFTLCIFFTAQTPFAMIFLLLLLGGLSRSLQFSALNTLAYAHFSDEKLSRTNTFYTVAQQVSFGLGVALSATILHVAMLIHDHTTPLTDDFSWAFIGMGVIALFSCLSYLNLPKKDFVREKITATPDG